MYNYTELKAEVYMYLCIKRWHNLLLMCCDGSIYFRNRDSFDSVTIKASRDEEIVEVTLNYRTNTDDASDSFLTVDFDSDVFGAPSTPFSGNETCERLSDDQYKCFVAKIFSEYEDVSSFSFFIF